MARHPHTLSITYWNANGIGSQTDEVADYLYGSDVDVLLVNETHLHSTQKLRFLNYDVYRKDRPPPQHGGGVAVVIKRSISHVQLPDTDIYTEAVGIQVNLHDGSKINIYSCYKRPQLALNPLELNALLDDTPTILMGDFNAKHQYWNSRRRNQAGRILFHYMTEHEGVDVLGPVEPTHYPTARGDPDVLDICIAKNITHTIQLNTLNMFNSDHMPVSVALADTTAFTHIEDQTRIDWNRYQYELQTQITDFPKNLNTIQDVDLEIANFTQDIHRCIEVSSLPALPKENPFILPRRIRELIREKNRVRRQYQRTRDPALAHRRNVLQTQVRLDIYEYKQDRWKTKIDSLSTEDCSLWRMAKLLRNPFQKTPPIHGTRGVKYTHQGKADAFAESLEGQFSPVYDNLDLDHASLVHREVSRYLNTTPNTDDINAASPAEVRKLLHNLKSKKAPGHDNISNKSLKLLHNVGIARLTNIFNTCLRLRYFPSVWKKADVIVLPKPGKDPQFPQNYRPISLLPSLAKVYEKVILSRLETAIAGILPDEQFGFRAAHSTTHQTLRVAELVTAGFNRRQYTGALLLDVSKAFDTVWHRGLLYKLIQSNCPEYLTKLVASFLHNREFRVKLKSTPPTFSTYRRIDAGVPQGSCLSPLLYIFYCADIPKTVGTELYLYADDTALTTQSVSPFLVIRRLQEAADAMEDWFARWRIKINSEKSQAILFSQRPTPQNRPNITMFGSDIPWSNEVNYLGITFDTRLTWRAHITNTRAKATKGLGALSPLIKSHSPLSLENKIRLYKQIVLPSITYGCSTWGYACKTSLKYLQVIQNRALRQATDAPWFVRNSILHRDLKIPTLPEVFKKLAASFYENLEINPNPLIANLGTYDPADFRFKRPKILLSVD